MESQMLEIQFPNSKREKKAKGQWGGIFCHCVSIFIFYGQSPTSCYMLKMAGGASSWPALSWM